jgi:DMSO/TMAO reductase YedYZ heme-binding membrane subunit
MMTQTIERMKRIDKETIFLYLLGIPVLFPLLCMIPALVTTNTEVIASGVADVLGTGAAIALLLCLLVTPAVTLTGQYWITPLRQWYGRVFAVIALTDAITASLATEFAGDALQKIAGHPFLLAGALMVVIGIPLLATSSASAQKWLGRNWKTLHKGIYAIWALLIIHMALLFGFGNQPDDSIVHQRLYQILACSVLLFVLRIPVVKRWIIRHRKERNMKIVWLVTIPMILLFGIGMGFMINEAIFKSTTVVMLHPIVD